MELTITSILTTFGEVLGAIIGGIGDVAAFFVTNPLLLVSVGFTVAGLVVSFARGMIRN